MSDPIAEAHARALRNQITTGASYIDAESIRPTLRGQLIEAGHQPRWEHLGGGIMGWVVDLPGDRHALVTEDEGPSDEAQSTRYVVGVYPGNPEKTGAAGDTSPQRLDADLGIFDVLRVLGEEVNR